MLASNVAAVHLYQKSNLSSQHSIEGRDLNGSLPVSYSNWEMLKQFKIPRSGLISSIPQEYAGAWTLLEVFVLEDANITGIPPDFSAMVHLKVYSIQQLNVSTTTTQPLWILTSNMLPPNLEDVRLGKLLIVILLQHTAGKSGKYMQWACQMSFCHVNTVPICTAS